MAGYVELHTEVETPIGIQAAVVVVKGALLEESATRFDDVDMLEIDPAVDGAQTRASEEASPVATRHEAEVGAKTHGLLGEVGWSFVSQSATVRAQLDLCDRSFAAAACVHQETANSYP